MKAWHVEAISAPAILRDLPSPSPQPGTVLVRVAACALNFADLLMQSGKYQERPDLPYIPGMELAGEILETGSATDLPAGMGIGSRVAAVLTHGAMAEYALVPADRLIALPEAMSFAEAAAFPIAYGTSHLALAHKARLQAGETLLVLGASGGVGLTAVEIGKKLGARVIASARGAEKLAMAGEAGADHVIDSDTPDLKGQLRALGGVDVVYDAVGGDAFMAALSACRPEGRLLAIGFASGQVPQVPANLLLVKNLSVMGLYWGGYLKFAPKVLTDSLRCLFDWYAEGALRPHISHQLPFDAYPAGLDLLKERKSTGKVVILSP